MGYTLVSSRRTSEVVSPTVVQDVMLLGARTTPSGVYFERSVPYTDWLQSAGLVGAGERLDFYLLAPSDNIETELSSGRAIGASYIEDLDASGLVQGFVSFVLEVTSNNPAKPGPFLTTVDVPMDVVAAANIGGGGIIYAELNDAYTALQNTANA